MVNKYYYKVCSKLNLNCMVNYRANTYIHTYILTTKGRLASDMLQ